MMLELKNGKYEDKYIGIYGISIKDDSVLLIKKKNGPYDGQLDLPGGGMKFRERPEDALMREFKEEVGVSITDYKLFDVDSVNPDWYWKDTLVQTHHTGVFYIVNAFEGDIKHEVEIDEENDDSLGADYYPIKDLTKDKISLITILVLEKLGYEIK